MSCIFDCLSLLYAICIVGVSAITRRVNLCRTSQEPCRSKTEQTEPTEWSHQSLSVSEKFPAFYETRFVNNFTATHPGRDEESLNTPPPSLQLPYDPFHIISHIS